jgi:peptide-methionine (S)-S-oxide reductase
VFYDGEEQKRLAFQTRDREAAKRGKPITTELLPLGPFYVAEDYHQKYLLRQHRALMREFQAMYPDEKAFLASTAAARVNGYLAGHGTEAALRKDLDQLGLSRESQALLLATWKSCQR